MQGREQSEGWDETGDPEALKGAQPETTGDKQSGLGTEGQASIKGSRMQCVPEGKN